MNKLTERELIESLQAHREWAASAGASGRKLEFTGIDFSGMSLSRASLLGSRFDHCCLANTDCFAARFVSASFIESDLRGAFLVQADFSYAVLTGSQLCRASAFKASFYEANLRGADLNGIDLSRAFVNGANLEGTILRAANLEGADLGRCRLTGVDLHGAKGLDTVILKEWIDVGTGDHPIRLEGDQARSWLLRQAAEV